VNHNPQDRPRFFVAQGANLFGDDLYSVDGDSLAQAFQRRGRREAVEDRFILFFQFEFRMGDAVEQFPIIGQKEQSGCLAIEPADRNDALGDVYQFEHGVTAALVRRGRDVTGRLVEHQVTTALPFDHITIDPDHLTLGVDSHP
jgi:hypothetical protein